MRVTTLLIFLFLLSQTAMSQSRDFEAYNAGDLIVANDSEWAFWPQATIDAPVSTAQAQSGTKSLLVDGAPNQDLVFKLGNQTSGTWGVGFSMYIASGNGAYYNLQETEIPGVRWPIGNVEFDPGGTGALDAQATFVYPHDQWFDVRNYIDLDNDSFQVWINGGFVFGDAWTAALPQGGGTPQLQLGGINIYPQGDAGNNPSNQVFYLDDMYFQTDSLRTIPSNVVFTPFDLNSPSSGARVETDILNPSTPVTIDWSSTTVNAGPSVGYEWVIDLPSGNFGTPLAAISSNNSGNDTTLTLTLGAIDTLLSNLGVPRGDSVDVIWSVRATSGQERSLAANGPFNIKLVRDNLVLSPFNLLSPNNAARLETDQSSPSTTVDITWNESSIAGGGTITYEWLLDGPGGTFSPPLAAFSSNNNGEDTVLTLTLGAIDTLLGSLQLAPGDSVDAVWTVRASSNVFFGTAANGPFNLNLVRGLPTGLSKSNFETSISMYPNPTEGVLTVSDSRNIVESISILNLIGSEVKRFNNIAKTNQYDLNDLSNGVYLVKFITKEGNYTQKLILE